MFRLNSQVIIEKEKGARYIFNGIAGWRLETDMSSLTSTCTVKLPRKVKWEGDRIPIARGDDITVRLGYDENLTVRFVGKVTIVGIHAPLELECEDWMCKLKKEPVKNISGKQMLLSDLLGLLPLSGFDIRWEVYKDKDLEYFRWNGENASISDLLGKLKDEHQITSFFRLIDDVPVLYCGEGLPDPLNKQTWEFKWGLNLIKDETKLIVEDGKEYFTGSFITFGIPEVTAGDRIFFQPGEAPGAFYRVKKATTDFTVAEEHNSGYRQKIELGDKL